MRVWEERAGGGERGRAGAPAHSLVHTLPALPLPPTLQSGEDMEEGAASTERERQTDSWQGREGKRKEKETSR